MSMHAYFVAIAVGLSIASVATSQAPSGATRPPIIQRQTVSTVVSRQASIPPNSGGAFALEALAGSVGSLAGMAAVGFTSDCGVDDLACVIQAIGAGGALGVVGATLGATLTARATGSDYSVLGAVLGGLVGTAVGLGVHWLFNQNSDRNLGEYETIPLFAVSQGIFAAMGSRALGR
jgi:hypothetical protein